MQQLLKREGPKYQYGTGCLSDGVIGAWMARIYGIETPLAQSNVRIDSAGHLQAQLQDRPEPARQRAAARLRHGPRAGPAAVQLAARRQANAAVCLLRRSVDRHRIPGRLAPHSRRIRRRRPDHRQSRCAAATTGARAIRGTNTSAATGMRAPCRATRCWARSRAFATPRSSGPCGSRREVEDAAIRVLLLDGLGIRHDCAARPNGQRPHSSRANWRLTRLAFEERVACEWKVTVRDRCSVETKTI